MFNLTGLEYGIIGFVVLMALLALRIPIGVAMLLVGIGGYVEIAGKTALLSYLKTEVYYRFSTFDLSVAPLFILMGQLASKAGLSQALFTSAHRFLGHFRGGVAMASVGACAGFGAISGSSLATAAIMGQAALPELKRFKYAGSLATGCLAAGGTLGILIPPSLILIIYAVMVEANIATLFQAALLPGILAAAGYILVIAIIVRINPASGPAAPKASGKERWKSILDIWGVLLIFFLVMGGIYSGIFTPTEGAGIGCVGTFLLAVTRGRMRWQGIKDVCLGTASTTGLIFLIILGAAIFSAFLGFTELPNDLAEFFKTSGLPPVTVIIMMVVIYILLGFIMDSLSMILLTVPIFWPIIAALDFGMPVDDVKLWFGIISLIVVEVGLITPPVGMNVFVISSMAKDVPMIETFKGVIPFFLSDAVRVAFIVWLPSLTLFLPHLLMAD